ncbi:hypothetical protein KA977_13755 [Candidatus Dependentiae bacterium]|nr:hypothetical protein [Candidatus Dependentiae bacterium]
MTNEETKQVFTLSITSVAPQLKGLVSDSISKTSAEFANVGLLLDFINKNALCKCTAEKSYKKFMKKNENQEEISVPREAENLTCVCCESEDSDMEDVSPSEEIDKESDTKLEKKKKIDMPKREKIKEELKKISNFTDEEMSIMGWSSLYKAYSLIARYGQTGVEEEFRKLQWFGKEMKQIEKNRKREEKKNKGKDKAGKSSSKEDKKNKKEKVREERKSKKEQKKLEKEKKRAEKRKK